MLDFPAENFVAFFSNHRLLQYDRPAWRTVKGGSKNYVDKLTSAYGDQLRLGCAVTSIERTPHGARPRQPRQASDLRSRRCRRTQRSGARHALRRRRAGRAILGAIGYSPNTVYLHRDTRLMPKRRHARASGISCAGSAGVPVNDVAVTYWMNRLQGASTLQSRCSSASTRRSSRMGSLPSAILLRAPAY
jgi:predicted NAD/FAD-binding protein